MENETVIREEPGEYRIAVRHLPDGSFAVHGETARRITLTVRVEDAWERLPADMRRYSYTAVVRRDGEDMPLAILEDVAPDARIFLDFEKLFQIEFR
jgi:hypothetical protein